jgi:hypothetical protein
MEDQKVVLIRNESCKIGEILVPKEYKNVSEVIGSVTIKGLEQNGMERTFKSVGSSRYKKTVELNPKDMDRISKEDVCVVYIMM